MSLSRPPNLTAQIQGHQKFVLGGVKVVGEVQDFNTHQGSKIRSVRILFSERYVRTLTYSILAYVNKNRIHTQTVTAEAANWFFATVLINLLFDFVVQNDQFN